MNSSNSSSRSSTTPDTFSFLASLRNPWLTIQFYRYGYSACFLFGFPGNIASLATFSRSSLRTVSTGMLFIVLAMYDTTSLAIYVIDFVEFGLGISLYGSFYGNLCKFREFVRSTCQLGSAWTLVIICLDRWIRVRFPFKANRWCTPKTALLAVAIELVIIAGVNAHQLAWWFGSLIPGIANAACGPDIQNPAASSYRMFYYVDWVFLQVHECTFSDTT
jgi:hypothetical protein